MKGCSWLLTTALTAVCFMTGHVQSTNGPIRLWRNGNSSTEFTSGRVQLVYDSVWGNICWDANFGLTAADVICHQLRYTGALDFDRASDDEFGIDTGPTLLNNVKCSTSSYLVILQCDYETTPPPSCTDDDDVSVVCYSTRIWDNPYAGQVRLTGGNTVNEGLVEVYCNKSWGNVCELSTRSYEADTICRQLGYQSSSDYYTSEGILPVWFDRIPCSNSESYPCIGNCVTCPSSPITLCPTSSRLAVECQSSTSHSGGTTIDTCRNATIPVEIDVPMLILAAVIVAVICVSVIVFIVCLQLHKKKCRRPSVSSPNAQSQTSSRPGFTTDPQPEHTRSSFAYTPLPNADKSPPAYDLHDNLPTHNTQRTNEGSNLSPPHQPSYGACTPSTPYTSSTASVTPPSFSSGGYTGTGTSAVSPL